MTRLIPLVGAIGILLVYSGVTQSRVAISPTRIPRATVWWCTGLLGALAITLVSQDWRPGLVAWLVLVYMPRAILANLSRARRRRLAEAWPDALMSMLSLLRSGSSLPEACCELQWRGPRELRPAWEEFARAYRASGRMDVALRRMQSFLKDGVADRVVLYLTMATEVGGSEVVRLLETTATAIRRDLRIRKEIEARWSWTVLAARLAASSPWIVLLLMLTRPEAAAAYATPAGGAVLFWGAIATIAGYRLMLRAANLPEMKRIPR